MLLAAAATIAVRTAPLGDATALPDCGGAGADACGQLFETPAASGPGGTMGFDGSFLGAHYDPSWGLPAGKVGFCTDESAPGTAGPGAGTIIPLPSGRWTAEQEAHVAWLVSLGQNNANPYTDLATASGEWTHAGSAISPRNRMASVHLAIRDATPDLGTGRRFELTGSTGGGAIFQNTLRPLATKLADEAARYAVRGVPRVAIAWVGAEPKGPGTYRLRLTLTDSTGAPIEYAPVVPTVTGATVSFAGDATATVYRNAVAAGFPTQDGFGTIPGDRTDGRAGLTGLDGIAEFNIVLATNTAGSVSLSGTTTSSTVQLVDGGTGGQDNVTTAGTQSFSATALFEKAPRETTWLKLVRGADNQTTPGVGVTFALRDADGRLIGNLTTRADGRTPPVELVDGTYTYTETAVPAGVLLDPTPRFLVVTTEILDPLVIDVVDAVTPTVQTQIHDLRRGGAASNTALEGDRIPLGDDATVTGTPGTRATVTVDFYVVTSTAALCSGSPLATVSGEVLVGANGTGRLTLTTPATWTAQEGTWVVHAAERVSVPAVGWVGPRRCDSVGERYTLTVVPETRTLDGTA